MSIFGRVLRVTTFGQSHSSHVGCTVQGFPSNFLVDSVSIQKQLDRRKPGQSSLTTSRKQKDQVQIVCGLEAGKTLGSPITFLVKNQDTKPSDYSQFSNIPRPGHADYTYQKKYGIRSSSGGGRASARQTIGRICAGALAQQYLAEKFGTNFSSWVQSVGTISIPESENQKLIQSRLKWRQVESAGTVSKKGEYYAVREGTGLRFYDNKGSTVQRTTPAENEKVEVFRTRCPHPQTAISMVQAIIAAKQRKDSLGGVIQGCISNLPIGLGEPVFDKVCLYLQFGALMAHAMLSIPATKGFEYGSGFQGTKLPGSQHNDRFLADPSKPGLLKLRSNNSGGTLGGITTGQPFVFRVAFKPVSTIGLAQQTATFDGEMKILEASGRHDPCVLPRAPAIVDNMAALCALDLVLLQQTKSIRGYVANTDKQPILTLYQ